MLCFGKKVYANPKRNNFVALAAAAAQYSGFVSPFRTRRPVPFERQVMDSKSLKDRLLFAVVGCTGTGKTKLGVRLAKELGGEVVSADSIQVYKGLDVATNKATDEETDGVPHHMMGTVDWRDECNVHQYRNEALKIIQDIYSRGKVPVVVGGTSYYIESIIYDNLVQGSVAGESEPDAADDDDEHDDDEQDDEGDGLSANAFREYAGFRNVNDVQTATTAVGAGHMYVDALVEAVKFAQNMTAVGRLTVRRYRNTFVGADNVAEPWPPTVVECETAALYAHGVRVLDAVMASVGRTEGVLDIQFEVTAADVVVGHRERYRFGDIRSRLDDLLKLVKTADISMQDAGTVEVDAYVRKTLCRVHAEVQMRMQRLALALLADHERTAVDLLSPATLKAHAAYYDPVAASALHPHNTRKVFRTIQIYLVRGKQKSKLFEEQRTRVSGSDVPVVALRFKEVHMMWLTCDSDVLNRRLEERTDEMVERGLVDELCQFKTELSKMIGTDNFDLDFTKGVLQCIGLKQFQNYFELPVESRDTEAGRKCLEDALVAMKYMTKKYARRQIRWINNRFLKPNDKQAVSVYRLDCTDLGEWQQLSDRAVDLAQVVLGRKPRGQHTLEPIDVSDQKTVLPVYGDYYCDDCSRLFSNDIQYNIHMGSKKHVKVMMKRKRKLQDTTLHSGCDNEKKLYSP
ncbi:PREDICTED: tRNA dimethylallyltransferase, mitochondrial isoform X1 [Diuraphis noxia]|uniref:tRNA dimethylallyltransferase, mitochondrial isoform X1 n=1 Tax=Diuraphis noxia TaxID=143948 RepID=UPI000763AEC2|nr:PREDICTED: tRNA dimethylallyltransferase, mitochondrial isoform X1 [Diuraphis noxia]